MTIPCHTPHLRLRLPSNRSTSGDNNSSTSSVFTTMMFHQYKLGVDVYAVGLLCLFGITGNLISIVILGRDRTIRRTTGFLLQMLGLSDTVYLVTCLFYQTVNALNDLTSWLPIGVQHGWTFVGPFTWPCASIAQTCTVWLVVVVTADRYVAICNPLHSRQHRFLNCNVLLFMFKVFFCYNFL